LLEGSIQLSVANKSAARILKPGEQGVVEHAGNDLRVTEHADLGAAIAWKNGLFHFNHASLQDVMRQLARWYDVDIVYTGTIAPREFGGEISRNNNASEVLKILELSAVHFRIEGKKIMVMP
jgi:transmembrane sensor